jgi:hypothetical protein
MTTQHPTPPGTPSIARARLFQFPNVESAFDGRLAGRQVASTVAICPDCDNDGMVLADGAVRTAIPCPRCMLGQMVDEKTRSYQPGDRQDDAGNWIKHTFWERQPDIAAVFYGGGRTVFWDPCDECRANGRVVFANPVHGCCRCGPERPAPSAG